MSMFKDAVEAGGLMSYSPNCDDLYRRGAIYVDIHEREDVDGSAFKALVRRAVVLNGSGKAKPSKKAKS